MQKIISVAFGVLMSFGLFLTSVSAQTYQTIDVPSREELLEENKSLKQQISLLERQVYRLEMALEDTDFFTIDRSNGVPVANVSTQTAPPAETFQAMIQPAVPAVNQSFQNYTNKYLSFDHPTNWEVVSLGMATLVGPIDTDPYEANDEKPPVIAIYTVDVEDELEGKDVTKELEEFQEGYVDGFYKGAEKDFTDVSVASETEVVINGRTFKRVVVTATHEGEPHKQYMIFGTNGERLYGISFPATVDMFNRYWETVETMYQSIVFNDKVNVNRVGKNTPFKNEYFEFDYTNDWEMSNLGEIVLLTSPFQSKEDNFQESVILTHERLTEEFEGLNTDELLKKMETDDKASVDYMEILEEGEESVAGFTFKKQLIFAKIGQLEFVQVRYAYADGEDAYFVNYTALPDQVEAMGNQFKQIIESLELPDKSNVQGIEFERTWVPFA